MADFAFGQFVLKIHSRCNLACDYCYVYEGPDQSWRDQPTTISRDVVRQAARRVAEHAAAHDLPRVRMVLHGGEPLLVGRARLREIIDELRGTIGAVAGLDLALQTNGVLLDEQTAAYLASESVRVGISLDGGRAANDRHRLTKRGRSSYDAVAAAAEIMTRPAFAPHYAGLLCTIDPANDPVQVFHDLAALRPPRVDLLLPHATWELPPPAGLPGRTIYGDWLVAFFDAWYAAPPLVGVRLFQEIMHALLGGASQSEAVGLSAPEAVFIETDGSIQRTDALKIAYAGAPATGYDIVTNSLDDVLEHPAVRAGALGLASLAASCRACPIVAACGGGHYAHRYRETNAFDNPSVYCLDLARLINHVRDRVTADLAARPDLGVAVGGPAGVAAGGPAVRPVEVSVNAAGEFSVHGSGEGRARTSVDA